MVDGLQLRYKRASSSLHITHRQRMYCTEDVSVIGSRPGRCGTSITQRLQNKCRVPSAQTSLNPPCQNMPKRLHTERDLEQRAGATRAVRFQLPKARPKERQNSVFGNSVFPGATNFEGYTQAESRNAVWPSRFFVEKNHGSQPPATADSIIFTSFRCSGKKNEFQNVVRNLNFKKSSRCYIGFRMGVPNVELDLGYIYPKYPPKTLNK